MSQVHFLSQNRPGPRMGMGHYERLLIQSLGEVAAAARDPWRFAITFEGRTPDAPLDSNALDAALSEADFLGYSTARLAKVPLSVAQLLLNLRFKARPDLYHSLALSFPLPTNARGVFTIHDLPPSRFSDEGTLASWAKSTAQAARFLITPSEFAKRELVELLQVPAERVVVIPYGCEHDRYHPGVEAATPSQLTSWGINGAFVLYAGGFTQRKNVTALLKAWQSVESKFSDLTLVLAGPQAKLSELASAVNAPRVLPMGYVDYTEMPKLMKASRALLFPSIYEGFGLPPQEAMALGVPVLISAEGGATPEVVGDAGIVARDGSAESLAAAIDELLSDEALQSRLKEAGPKRVERYSWPNHARAVLDVYRRALSE